MKLFLIILIHFALRDMATMFKILVQGGTKSCCPSKRYPQTIFWSLFRMRTRESHQLKTVLARNEQEIEQDLSQPNCQKLKPLSRDVWIKRAGPETLRPETKEFEQEHG